MEILIWLAIPTLLIWLLVSLVYADKAGRLALPLLTLPILGSAAIILGTVLGREFFHVSLGPFPLTLDRALIIGWVGFFGIQYLRQHESIRPFDRSELIILALYGYLVASLFLHDWQFQEKTPLSRMIFFYGFPLVAYLVIRTCRLSKNFLIANAVLFAGLAIFLAGIGIAEWRDWAWLVYPKYIMQPGEFLGRARGPLLNPVINGVLMIFGCCCLWMGWKEGNRWIRSLIVLGSIFIAIGIFCTLTRSVWLGFVASAALFIWFPASRTAKSAMLIAAVMAILLTFPVVGEKLSSFKRDREVSVEDMEMSAKLRPIFAAVAWKMFQDRPLLGCGFGQYPREKWAYLSDPHSELQLILAKDYLQHNVFLAYLTELGLIGTGLLVATLLMMGIAGWRLWCNSSLDLIHRLYGLAMVSLALNYVINGMFHDVSIISMANMLLLFHFGIVNNLNHAAKANPAAEATLTSAEPRYRISVQPRIS